MTMTTTQQDTISDLEYGLIKRRKEITQWAWIKSVRFTLQQADRFQVYMFLAEDDMAQGDEEEHFIDAVERVNRSKLNLEKCSELLDQIN